MRTAWILLLAVAASFPARAQPAQPFEVRQTNLPDGSSALAVIANARTAAVSIVYLPELLRSREPTLISYAEQIGSRERAFSIFSVSLESLSPGLYSQTSRFAPRGLVLTNGRLISEIHDSLRPGRIEDDECADPDAKERISRLSVVCVLGDGQVMLFRIGDPGLAQKMGACRDAIQAGEFLVDRNRSVNECRRTLPGPRARSRTVLCAGRDGWLALVFARGSRGAIADWLTRGIGPGCDSAVELSRDAFASTMVYDNRRGILKDGAVGGPMPTAIVIKAR